MNESPGQSGTGTRGPEHRKLKGAEGMMGIGFQRRTLLEHFARESTEEKYGGRMRGKTGD